MSGCTLQDVFVTCPDLYSQEAASGFNTKLELHIRAILTSAETDLMEASQSVVFSINGSIRCEVGKAWAVQELYVYNTSRIPISELDLQPSKSGDKTSILTMVMKIPPTAVFHQPFLATSLAPSFRMNGWCFVNGHTAISDNQRVSGSCTLSNTLSTTYFGNMAQEPTPPTYQNLTISTATLRRFRCIQPRVRLIVDRPMCFDGLATMSPSLQRLLKNVWSSPSPTPALRVQLGSSWDSGDSKWMDSKAEPPEYNSNVILVPIYVTLHYLQGRNKSSAPEMIHELTKHIDCKVSASWVARRAFNVPTGSSTVTSSLFIKQDSVVHFPPFCPARCEEVGGCTSDDRASYYVTQSMIELPVPDAISTPSMKTTLLKNDYSLQFDLKFIWESIKLGRERESVFTCRTTVPLSVSTGPQDICT